MVRQKILISGYIGFGNAGDEAIAGTIIRHLRETFPEPEITVISGDPDQTAAAYGVHPVAWRDPKAITEAVHTTDLTIIGGGGIFHDYWGFDPDALLTPHHSGLSFYIAPALVSALFGKPVMLYAVGVGPLLSEHGRDFTRAAAEIANRITVRDPISRAALENLGIPAGKIALTADPAFDLQPEPAIEHTEQLAEWTSSRPAIAVCLRNWSFGVDPSFSEREIAAALDDILSEGGRVLFVPFHRDPGNQDDIAVAHRVRAQLHHLDRATVLTNVPAPAPLAGILGQADLVLAMRLHAAILGFTARVPVVAIEYDPKLGGLAGLTGLQEYTLPLGGINRLTLARTMREALANSRSFACHAEKQLPELRMGARENAVIARELLASPAVAPYSPETNEVLGRLITAQVSMAEALTRRVRSCCEVVDPSLLPLPPVEMAGTLVWRVNDLKGRNDILREQSNATRGRLDDLAEDLARCRKDYEEAFGARNWFEQQHHRGERLLRETEQARTKLATENVRIAQQLQETSAALEAERSTHVRLNAESEQARAAAGRAEWQTAALQQQLASYHVIAPGAIVKRGFQVILDALQWITPAGLRAAVRQSYLEWFYFRLYPERRNAGNAPHSGRHN